MSLEKIQKPQPKLHHTDKPGDDFANNLLNALNSGAPLTPKDMPKPAKKATVVFSKPNTQKAAPIVPPVPVTLPTVKPAAAPKKVSAPVHVQEPAQQKAVTLPSTEPANTWSEEDDTVLRNLYPIAGAGVAALIPNHTEEECIRRAKSSRYCGVAQQKCTRYCIPCGECGFKPVVRRVVVSLPEGSVDLSTDPTWRTHLWRLFHSLRGVRI